VNIQLTYTRFLLPETSPSSVYPVQKHVIQRCEDALQVAFALSITQSDKNKGKGNAAEIGV